MRSRRDESGGDGGTAVPVALSEVSKAYGRGRSAICALDRVSVEFANESFTAVMGPSGSGKSTLLHCAAGLERPSSGVVRLAGHDLGRLSETKVTEFRRARVGFVFQSFNLVAALDVRENVLLPLRLSHVRWQRHWPEEVIEKVGLEDRVRHRPGQLSGGEEQRVAIARALVTRPDVIFCDEPTGALDSNNAADVLGLLRQAVDADHQTVVMVTHDPVAASYADRVVFLADGRIVDDIAAPGVDGIAARLARLGRRAAPERPS